MKLLEERKALLAKANEALANAKSNEDLAAVAGIKEEIELIDRRIKAAKEFDSLSAQQVEEKNDRFEKRVKSLGDHFFTTSGDRFAAAKGISGASVVAPEFKQGSEELPARTVLAHGGVTDVFSNDVIRQFIPVHRRRLTVRDLLGSYQISGNAVTYFEEGELSAGAGFKTVKEGEKKPELKPVAPVKHTETLTKIAGYWSVTDEMLEDQEFLVNGINERLTYNLLLAEEDQLLNGDGSGSNIKGLLKRNGVLTATGKKTAAADTIFNAMTKIREASVYAPDAFIINPADWEVLRLAKDKNDQYLAGGPFYGQYGNPGMVIEPNLWGLTPVITPAIASGTVLLGAFNQGAQVAEKGGLRIDYTNTHDKDFIYNRGLFRLEKRELLMVPSPKSFAKITLS